MLKSITWATVWRMDCRRHEAEDVWKAWKQQNDYHNGLGKMSWSRGQRYLSERERKWIGDLLWSKTNKKC